MTKYLKDWKMTDDFNWLTLMRTTGESPEETAHMRRLVWDFAACIYMYDKLQNSMN